MPGHPQLIFKNIDNFIINEYYPETRHRTILTIARLNPSRLAVLIYSLFLPISWLGSAACPDSITCLQHNISTDSSDNALRQTKCETHHNSDTTNSAQCNTRFYYPNRKKPWACSFRFDQYIFTFVWLAFALLKRKKLAFTP